MSKKIVVGVVAMVALGAGFAALAAAKPAAPEDDLGLLGTLTQWQYPGSKWIDGATMSDGGNRGMQSVKCQSVLTTPDSFDKVIKFYADKLPKLEAFGPGDVKAEAGADRGKVISDQDDSADRPVQLRVFVVNRAASSTTLVISRAEGEKETHIAWSHWKHFDDQP